MNTCKTCKWWGKIDSYGKCGKLTERQDTQYSPDDMLAIGCDEIFTGPDFGCIHHEGKAE